MPTSLIFVLLAAAWLVVLVPIVARRREKVPEMDESGARFRVLPRASGSIRKRRLRRAEAGAEGDLDLDASDDLDDERESDELEESGPLDEELLDEELVDEELVDADEAELDAPEPVQATPRAREPIAAEPIAAEPVSRPVRTQERVTADPTRQRVTAEPTRRRVHAGSSPVAVAEPPSASEPTWQSAPAARTETARTETVRIESNRTEFGADVQDDQRYRPVPQRHGRGGYDPEAAERVRTYRYQRRRRVTAILLLATIVFGLAAYFLRPVLWAGTALFALLLVGYLAYLRRQVRIEADIRRRRLAKMQRARQIRPEYRVTPPATARRSEHADVQVTSGQTTMSVPPAAYTRNRQVVDLDDDDPGFDDLEYYEPYRYRRAAGQ